tara:strand:- start:370 stop:594 length:225 start_codon:yes stop_codon:yes gene_type:complete
MNEKLYTMLHSAATADKAKALLSIDLLSNNPVGIGDHTTEDFYKNAGEALSTFAGAQERLEILEKYFKPGKSVI